MADVIVTVKHADEARLLDVQLASDIPAERLTASLAECLGWDQDTSGKLIKYEVEALPLGRRLLPNETLADANIWDGAWLIMHPKLAVQPQTRAPQTKAGYNMTRLDPGLSLDGGTSASEPVSGQPSKTSGYVWKRLDDE